MKRNEARREMRRNERPSSKLVIIIDDSAPKICVLMGWWQIYVRNGKFICLQNYRFCSELIIYINSNETHILGLGVVGINSHAECVRDTRVCLCVCGHNDFWWSDGHKYLIYYHRLPSLTHNLFHLISVFSAKHMPSALVPSPLMSWVFLVLSIYFLVGRMLIILCRRQVYLRILEGIRVCKFLWAKKKFKRIEL